MWHSRILWRVVTQTSPGRLQLQRIGTERGPISEGESWESERGLLQLWFIAVLDLGVYDTHFFSQATYVWSERFVSIQFRLFPFCTQKFHSVDNGSWFFVLGLFTSVIHHFILRTGKLPLTHFNSLPILPEFGSVGHIDYLWCNVTGSVS